MSLVFILQLRVCAFWLPSSNSWSSHSPPLVTIKLFLFLWVCLLVCFWSIIDQTMLVPVIEHSDSIFLYISKWLPQCFVTIIHYTKKGHNYQLYFPHCTFHICGSFVLQLKVCTSLSPSLISLFPPLLWHPPVCSLCGWLFLFVHLFCFLYFKYKWNHTVFVFLCLTYFG